MNLTELNYGLYARKSNESEDKQVASLDDQVETMTELADSKNYRIIEEAIYKESKSAKIPDERDDFDELIEQIEKGTINAILTYKSNRLSRNPKESGLIQQMIFDGKIKAIVTADKVYLPDDNALIFSIDAAQDSQFSRDLSKIVKDRMTQKAKKGWLPGRPPIGYLNNHLDKTIIADPDRFQLVRKLWDMALTETYTVAEITRLAESQIGLRQPIRKKSGGNPLSYSGTYAMFRNPFYMGKVEHGDVEADGKHPQMVTEAEFDKVQAYLNPGYTTRPKDKDYVFAFRGMFRCGDCGFAVTTQRKIKKLADGSESTHIYCHCTGRRKGYICTQKSIYTKEDEFNEQVKERLSRFTISPDFYKLAIEALAEEDSEEVAKQNAVSTAHDKAVSRKKADMDGLRRMRYTGELTDSDFFNSEMKKLEKELKDLQKARNTDEIAARDWRKLADETFTFARYAKEDFESDNLENKRTVLRKLGQNLTVLDGKIQFTPVKYLVPIEEAYPELVAQLEMVRTMPQQRKNAALSDVSSQWYTRQDLNL